MDKKEILNHLLDELNWKDNYECFFDNDKQEIVIRWL